MCFWVLSSKVDDLREQCTPSEFGQRQHLIIRVIARSTLSNRVPQRVRYGTDFPDRGRINQCPDARHPVQAVLAAYRKAVAVHGEIGPYWESRRCFIEPIPAFKTVASLLSSAVGALTAGQTERAQKLVDDAELTEVVEFGMPIMLSDQHHLLRWRPAISPKGLVNERNGSPKVSPPLLKQVLERDNWRCRYCGCPVVGWKAMERLLQFVAVRWTACYGDHAAFYFMKAVADHVQPHSWGGLTIKDNLVAACTLCNYMRNSRLLEELGIISPLERDAYPADGWDGLEFVMALPAPRSPVPIEMPDINMNAWGTYKTTLERREIARQKERLKRCTQNTGSS